MTKMPDKGITSITYNHLNLPKEIAQVNNTRYYYRADGVKIRKAFTLNNSEGSTVTNSEYLDGFQYVTRSAEIAQAFKSTDEATMDAKTAGQEETFVSREAAAVPQPQTTMVLSFFPTAEGFYDVENSKYIWQYKDHLGNVRLSYAQDSAGALEIVDRNDFYPFGMNFVGYYSVFDAQGSLFNYKYNGKELQETGMYDYGARFYMPDIGRWGVPDILAETFRKWSPYTYVYDNPMRFVDPTGMFGEDPKKPDPNKIYKGGEIQEVVITKEITPVKGQVAGTSFEMPSNCLICNTSSTFSINLPPPRPIVIDPYRDCGHCHDRGVIMMSGDTFGFTDLAGILFNNWYEDLEPDEQKGAIILGGMAIILTHNTKIAGAEAEAIIGASKGEIQITKHAAERMLERGITQKMIETGISKGTKYLDPKNGTFNYVLKNGFASGKDLLIGVSPQTGKVTTVLRGRNLVNKRFIPQ